MKISAASAAALASNTNSNNATAAPIVPKTEPDPIGTEESMEFPTPNSTSTPNVSKRPAFLDLNKKNKRAMAPLLIDSPDVPLKTLNTPDLEKILLSGGLLQTPQPGTVFPTKVGPITSEQEAFGKGFEEALQNLHTSKNSQAFLGNNTNAPTAASNPAPVAPATMTAVNNGISGGFTYTSVGEYHLLIYSESSRV